MGNFKGSGRNNPCPVCSRVKDDSCRMTDDLFVMCHSETTQKKGDEQSGYVFVGLSKDGGTWGMWKPKSEDWKAERPTGQEFKYPFYNADGNLVVTEVRTYNPDGKKKTWMEPSGTDTRTLLPYRYRDALAALENGAQHFVIAEGPPKAEALWAIGIPAVAFANGFKHDRDRSWFEGHETKLLVASDQDKPGVKKAADILAAYPMAKLLRPWPKSTNWDDQWLPDGSGRDIKDWIDEMSAKGMAKAAIAEVVLAGVVNQSLPPTVETRITKDRPRPEDYFGSVADLVAAVNKIRADHGFETPDYRLAIQKLSMASKMSKDFILKLYYDATNPNPDGAIVSSQEIANSPEEESELWLFPDLMPTSWVTLFYASGGTGKTRLCHELAKAAVSGGTFLQEYPASFPMKVLFIQIDEPSGQFHDLIRHDPGLQHENLHILTNWSSRNVDQLQEQIIEHGYNLVILDSLMAAQRDSGLEIKDAAFGNILREFQNICNRTKVSFIVLHHTNRAGEFTGNNSIKDAVSCVWELRRGCKEKDIVALKSDERVLDIGAIKIRKGAPNELLLRFEEDEGSFVYQGNYKKLSQPEAKASWSEKIMMYFNANPTIESTASDLTEVRILDGLAKKTAKQTCDRLRGRGLLLSRKTDAPISGTEQTLYSLARARKNENLYTPLAKATTQQEIQPIDRGLQRGLQGVYKGSTGGSTNTGAQDRGLQHRGLQSKSVDPYENGLKPIQGKENGEGSTLLRTRGGGEISPELEQRFRGKKDPVIDQRNRPTNNYSGPLVSTLVKLTRDKVTDSEVLKMSKVGQEPAWGTHWAVAEVNYDKKGWFVILEDTDGRRLTVDNLNILEIVEEVEL